MRTSGLEAMPVLEILLNHGLYAHGLKMKIAQKPCIMELYLIILFMRVVELNKAYMYKKFVGHGLSNLRGFRSFYPLKPWVEEKIKQRFGGTIRHGVKYIK